MSQNTKNQSNASSKPIIRKLLFLPFLLPFLPTNANASNNCRPANTRIDIIRDIRPLQLHHNLDKDKIHALANKFRKGPPEFTGRTLGFFRPKSSYKVNFKGRQHQVRRYKVRQYKGRKRQGKGYPVYNCIMPTVVTFHYILERDIYIPKEYAKDSCQYRVIYEHEMLHLRFEINILNKYEKKIGEALSRALHGRTFSSSGEMNQYINYYSGKIWQKIAAEQRKLHRTIDNPENYALENKLCPSW